jgi:transketolase
MAYVLFTRHLKHNPADPKWPDRDRFVLSGGHGSMLLYSLLHLTGYDLSLDDLKNFRQWGSKTPGHPEYGLTPGVETTTGPLGQGFSTAVGMAMAEAHLAAVYNRPEQEIVNHHTYVIASDGDMMEGVASEAASLAGHLKLGKLICLYDSNSISLDGVLSLSFSEDVGKRFEAYDWQVLHVSDGNDVEAIDAAIQSAKEDQNHPSLIVVKTIIGYGSPNKQGMAKSHGSPLGADEVIATKKNLNWPTEPDFYIPNEALEHFRKSLARGSAVETAWMQIFSAWAKANPDMSKQWDAAFSGKLPEGWDNDIPLFGIADSAATRASGGKVINAIAKNYPALFGGSADLNSSTNTALKGMGDFESPACAGDGEEGMVGGGWEYAGRNVHFGVREHAMAAAANGIVLHGGLRPFVSTFFNFVDYLKPSLRLSALMEQPVIYVFTHDSIALGEDGPTHQPIEQLAMLRAIPNVLDLRPSDANETAEAWKMAAAHLDGPSVIILSRQKTPNLDRTVFSSATGVSKGAYILREASGGEPALILIATGSEVSLIVEAADRLEEQGIATRVVSMPSWKLFESQPMEYRKNVLLPGTPKLAVEAGASLGWHKYVGSEGDVLAIDHFGASAPAEILLEKFGFTTANVIKRAQELLHRNRR